MDKLEKKKLANERRLKAIQEWQRNRNHSVIKAERGTSGETASGQRLNKVRKFDFDDEHSSEKNKLKLFDSDAEEDDLNDCFKIRPQFEGKNGQQRLEMSSQLSDRFKLDERFQDDEEPVKVDDPEDSEKNKNIRILESLLGHEVSKKHPTDLNSRKKTEIKRFDPEEDNGSKYVKTMENVQKKPKKKNKKIESAVPNKEIPYSADRYIEVTPDFKEILNTAGTFSFTEKFNLNEHAKDFQMDEDMESNNTNSIYEKDPHQMNRNKDYWSRNNTTDYPKGDFECSTSLKDPFFIPENDERLKEGIEFFVRPKALDEIREEWLGKQNKVMEIFRSKRKAVQRKSNRHNRKQIQKYQYVAKK